MKVCWAGGRTLKYDGGKKLKSKKDRKKFVTLDNVIRTA